MTLSRLNTVRLFNKRPCYNAGGLLKVNHLKGAWYLPSVCVRLPLGCNKTYHLWLMNSDSKHTSGNHDTHRVQNQYLICQCHCHFTQTMLQWHLILQYTCLNNQIQCFLPTIKHNSRNNKATKLTFLCNNHVRHTTSRQTSSLTGD